MEAPMTNESSVPVHRHPLWSSVATPLGLYVVARGVMLLLLGSVARARNYDIGHYLRAWDGKWYLLIARTGYATHIPPGSGNPAQSDLGFFPLLPLLIRGMHALTHLGWLTCGELVITMAGAAGSVVLWQFLRDQVDAAASTRGLALVLFSPAAVVLSMVYSESLFLLFVSLTLLSLRRRRWFVAGLSAAATSALDPVATAILIPCVWAAYNAIRQRGEWRALVAPLLAPVGLLWFFTYLWRHTGSFFEWFHAQRAGWQSGPLGTGIFYNAGKFAAHFFADQNPAAKSLAFLVAIGLVWWVARHGRAPVALAYALAVLACGALSPIIGISPRLLLRAFPLLAIAGATLPQPRYNQLMAGSLLSMSCLAVMSTSAHWTP
jgi:hypothetical protein